MMNTLPSVELFLLLAVISLVLYAIGNFAVSMTITLAQALRRGADQVDSKVAELNAKLRSDPSKNLGVDSDRDLILLWMERLHGLSAELHENVQHHQITGAIETVERLETAIKVVERQEPGFAATGVKSLASISSEVVTTGLEQVAIRLEEALGRIGLLGTWREPLLTEVAVRQLAYLAELAWMQKSQQPVYQTAVRCLWEIGAAVYFSNLEGDPRNTLKRQLGRLMEHTDPAAVIQIADDLVAEYEEEAFQYDLPLDSPYSGVVLGGAHRHAALQSLIREFRQEHGASVEDPVHS